MINIELYKEERKKIKEKLYQISLLDQPSKPEGPYNFREIDQDDEGVYYKMVDRWGEDPFTLFVSWEELNNPLEYFEQKYQKQVEVIEERKRRERAKERVLKTRREKALYEKLKKKFEKQDGV